MIQLLIFLSIIILNVQADISSNCHHTNSLGHEYDLNPLKKPQFWKVKDTNGDSGIFSMDYIFNFCNLGSLKCKDLPDVGAYEALEVLGQLTDTCEVIGKGKSPQVTHIDKGNPDKGIKITYGDGDICSNSENSAENGSKRKVNFLIVCSDQQDSNFAQSKVNSLGVTKCNLEFSINSPAGCRIGFIKSRNSYGTIFFWVLLITCLYLGLGIAYNIKVNYSVFFFLKTNIFLFFFCVKFLHTYLK